MLALREEIRTILREELAALRGEITSACEVVEIRSTADLNAFVQDLMARATEPDFAANVVNGRIRFVLAATSMDTEHYGVRPIVTSSSNPANVVLTKALVTERDILELGESIRVVRVSHQSRLTPLANDEARRQGIRIERIDV